MHTGESSRTTHGHGPRWTHFGGLLAGRFSPVPGYWDDHPLCPEIDAVAAGSFREKERPAIRGSGYVVSCLEAALWAFYRSTSFWEGCVCWR